MSDILDTPEFKASMRKVGALVNVVGRIIERPGHAPPSKAVQRKAAGLLAHTPPKITHYVGPCLLRYVDGESGRYRVVLKINPTTSDSMTYFGHYSIIDAECSCPAGHADKHCAHVLAVLAEEDLADHKLES
jgi:hypothetical protein